MAALTALFALASSLPAPFVGDRFSLRVGEMETLTNGPAITWVSVAPAGNCGRGRSECVMVTPPQAEVQIVDRGVATRTTLLLMGPRSRAGVAGKWVVEIVGISPYPFGESDIALGRMRGTFVVKLDVADVQ